MQLLFGKGLVTKYLLTVLTSVSFEDCKNECASRPMCVLALYQRSQVCELHTAMAARPENIKVVPGATLMPNRTPIVWCGNNSCLGDPSLIRAPTECGRPDETNYKLHRGNMYSVGDSALVLLPQETTPGPIICLDTGEWKLEPERGFFPASSDCTDIQKRGFTESGVYFVNETFYFLCTFDGSGEAWLTFQKRVDGSVNFYNNWADNVTGFGSMQSEFWFGLEKLHRIVSSFPGQYELRIDLEIFNGSSYYALYSTFDLKGADDNYRLVVGEYTGTAGDALTYHNGMQFTTYDRDNDALSTGNCALYYHSAWWYKVCFQSDLNAAMVPGGNIYRQNVYWLALAGWRKRMMKTEMKIRRRSLPQDK